MLKYPEGLLSGHILKYRLIHRSQPVFFCSLALFSEVISILSVLLSQYFSTFKEVLAICSLLLDKELWTKL